MLSYKLSYKILCICISLEFLFDAYTFGKEFNQTVENLPNSIQNIVFAYMFNQSIDNLPNSIQSITFGCSFNFPIKKIPPKLSTLNINKNNQNIKTISKSVLELNPDVKIIEIYL